MEEKKSIKSSLGIVICIIIIVLLVALVGMWYHYNKPTSTNNNTLETEEIANKRINKIYEDKEIVYTTSINYSNEYTYDLPCININSEEVATINAKIQGEYIASMGISQVKYEKYINNNVLSLVITTSYPNDVNNYQVYNIDIYTGKQVFNSELLNIKNIQEKVYLNQLENLYKEKFISLYGTEEEYIEGMKNAPANWTEEELEQKAKEYKEQFNKTISIENYSMKTPIFLGNNGKINVVATIYSLAGANEYLHIIETNI